MKSDVEQRIDDLEAWAGQEKWYAEYHGEGTEQYKYHTTRAELLQDEANKIKESLKLSDCRNDAAKIDVDLNQTITEIKNLCAKIRCLALNINKKR
jgi:hypothetical protein